jgi:hypothetical protein
VTGTPSSEGIMSPTIRPENSFIESLLHVPKSNDVL